MRAGAGPLAARRKSWIQLYSSFPFAECLTRLGSAAEKNISYYPRTSGDDRVTFELEMRRDRFSPALLAPYFCGVLQRDGDSGRTMIVGRFGVPPRARLGAIGIDVLAVLSGGASVFLDASVNIEWVALALVVGILGLFVNRWRLRHEKDEIIRFLAFVLDAAEEKRSHG